MQLIGLCTHTLLGSEAATKIRVEVVLCNYLYIESTIIIVLPGSIYEVVQTTSSDEHECAIIVSYITLVLVSGFKPQAI